eukprot:2038433-Prorocentrum_lima.AAC.1
MTSSLVGSEMCIRDSMCSNALLFQFSANAREEDLGLLCNKTTSLICFNGCLLYTSDAADDM